MESVFVPAGEVSAILSQLSASRLDLRRFEGLNGLPSEFFRAWFLSDALGLSNDEYVIRRMQLLESHGVAVAMSGASSLDRMASVLENDNLHWSRPARDGTIQMSNRPGDASGEREPPEQAGRVSPEGGSP